jgi:hypothetical protein
MGKVRLSLGLRLVGEDFEGSVSVSPTEGSHVALESRSLFSFARAPAVGECSWLLFSPLWARSWERPGFPDLSAVDLVWYALR